MEKKIDCFAYNAIKNECEALEKVYCKKEACAFYKTKEQLEQDEEKASLRREALEREKEELQEIDYVEPRPNNFV